MLNRYQTGLTLIELTLLILVMGVVIVPLSTGLLSASRSFSVNDELHKSTADAQACADHILAIRRDPAQGYSAIVDGGGMCSSISSISGLTRTVTVTDTSANPPCPSGDCKDVLIDVSINGGSKASLSLLLMQ